MPCLFQNYKIAASPIAQVIPIFNYRSKFEKKCLNKACWRFLVLDLKDSEKVDVHQSGRYVCFHGNAVGQVSCLFYGQLKGEELSIQATNARVLMEPIGEHNKPSAFLPSKLGNSKYDLFCGKTYLMTVRAKHVLFPCLVIPFEARFLYFSNSVKQNAPINKFLKNWKTTYKEFCNTYKIDPSNFGAWLNGKRKSKASRNAVSLYLSTIPKENLNTEENSKVITPNCSVVTEEDLRNTFRKRWHQTQKTFCTKYRIDSDNFSAWLNGEKNSKASRDAVSLYISTIQKQDRC